MKNKSKKPTPGARLDLFAKRYPNSLTWKMLHVVFDTEDSPWAESLCRSQDRARRRDGIPSVFK